MSVVSHTSIERDRVKKPGGFIVLWSGMVFFVLLVSLTMSMNIFKVIYHSSRRVHVNQKNKTTTAAFAKGCNVVTGKTTVGAWTMADLAKVKLAISANGVAIGGRRYQLKIAKNEL